MFVNVVGCPPGTLSRKLVDLPANFAEQHPGPKFGADGTRRIMKDHRGPLIGTIIKPSIGLDSSGAAALVGALVKAGTDFIKDDE